MGPTTTFKIRKLLHHLKQLQPVHSVNWYNDFSTPRCTRDAAPGAGNEITLLLNDEWTMFFFSLQTTTMAEVRYFSVWDYVVFAAMLSVSVAIGIYSAFSGGRQSTAEEILLGNRRLNPIPVGLSIMASTISAIAIMGIPAEIYNYNTMFGWIIVCYIPAYFFIITLLLPVYMNMKITSIFEVIITLKKLPILWNMHYICLWKKCY